ncbi:MAG: TerC family protein [Xanthomonadales bacterium]|nr:TerC family protein [Xanthomonadales bacterium]
MSLTVWALFLAFILGMVALDLGVFHREPRAPTIREAVGWTVVWVVLALAFNGVVFVLYENDYTWAGMSTGHIGGAQAASQYLLGYVLEKSLSLDNVFVIAMIFAYFGVPTEHQHRVLFWGILGAVVLRGLMITLGVALIHRFDWITYAFGLLLFYTAVRMMLLRHESLEPGRNALVRAAQRWVPVSDELHGSRFFVRLDGRLVATPLLLTLLLVESSDIMFAVDSIPAVFAVTQDPFIVFTSNIFAILGLRSLYFVLAIYMERFRYLKHALVFVLAYVGVKMILHTHYHVHEFVSMAIIFGILAVGVAASIAGGAKDPVSLQSPLR